MAFGGRSAPRVAFSRVHARWHAVQPVLTQASVRGCGGTYITVMFRLFICAALANFACEPGDEEFAVESVSSEGSGARDIAASISSHWEPTKGGD